ncbi:hypothetical protein Tco_0612807 [Tanacetum coccineum]
MAMMARRCRACSDGRVDRPEGYPAVYPILPVIPDHSLSSRWTSSNRDVAEHASPFLHTVWLIVAPSSILRRLIVAPSLLSLECADERAALANLIANLTLDTEENKTVLKQLKKANASLTQELKECKTNLDETLSSALGCGGGEMMMDMKVVVRKAGGGGGGIREWRRGFGVIAEIDKDPDISLVQHDAEVQGRHGHDMEPDFEFTTAKEVYTTEKEVSTAEPVSTAGTLVSTAGASSAKDKGKAIIEEAETIQTKIKL